ncbi:MAG TPA: hypothetical protein VFT99_12835, partial [Roseiflexaceae bacterium]|nr:hypothetical protein [Roseiflexaceae bacterium]
KRTLMIGVHFGRDEDELDRLLSFRHERSELAGKSLDEVVAQMRGRGLAVGGPDDIRDYLRRCDDAGVEEVFFQWLQPDDIDRLEALADAIGEWLTPTQN